MIRLRFLLPFCALIISAFAGLALVSAQTRGDSSGIDIKAFDRLEWRSIGPANMDGRVADIAGVPGNANIVYVAAASGGLWKTVNGGTTWKPIFERQGTISIGAIALDPSSPDVIWVGTGESAVRNSVSFGDGIYRSTDGGKTWKYLGLKETEHISRIVVHPTNPDIVYVAAQGHAFGWNEDRGVFMTIDGGKTWQKTLYIDNEHGASDLDMDPNNPNVLYAGMWKFERHPWTFHSGDENGGIYKSIDGGRTWNKITKGFPKLMGRIAVRVAPSNSNVVYVLAETKEGLMFRSDDGGETFRETSRQGTIVSRGFYYTHVRVDPTNENRVYAVASTLFMSIDGGRTYRSITNNTHIDYHALWIDPKNPSRLWQGEDGGVAVSYDQGTTWEYVNNIPIGQLYQIHADNRQPFYYVMGGLQDNGAWTGPSRTKEPAGILNDDWRMVSFGDGFYIINHPDDPDLYLSESQGGNIVRSDMRTREQQLVRPWVGGGGGPAGENKYRFNWNSPIEMSPHDKNTVYLGGNVIFKSTDFGKTWTIISPDLSTNDPEKQKDGGGPVAPENTAAEFHCTVISIAESPIKAGTIWAGTDDGNLQVTTDGGKSWTNLIKNIPELKPNSPVSHIEPSRTSANVAYATFDRHMLDDFRPYIFKTTDGGKSWKNVTGDLPSAGYALVVKEDPKNPNVLYAGTELGLFVSYTGGDNWLPMNFKNMPKVSVHDIAIHPRENDMILATHGRAIWILDDITPIQKMTTEIANSDMHLFEIRPALRFTTRFTRYGIGEKVFTGPNPPYGALISYYLKDKPDDKTPVKLQILDGSGKVIKEIKALPKDKGLNRVVWDLSYEGAPLRRPLTPEQLQFFGGPRGPQAVPGKYTAKLFVGDKTQEQPVEVRMDPTVSVQTADLQTQFDYALKLRDMQSIINNDLRALDSIKDQLQQVDKTIKDRMPDAPKDLLTAISDNTKQVQSLLGELEEAPDGLGISGRSKVSDQVGGLFFTIDGTNAAPTPAQIEAFGELQTLFKQEIEKVNKFLGQTIPQLNDNLKRNNGPQIIVGKYGDMK
ncbi:MAG TPA: hypothetical protein VFC63_09900 [Blastocatellia bacterium]|nr:hypothetical protein [Blastocatellia bacterium]